jgi:hypothetical protein
VLVVPFPWFVQFLFPVEQEPTVHDAHDNAVLPIAAVLLFFVPPL